MAWVFVRLRWRLLANAGAGSAELAFMWLRRALGLSAAAVGAVDLATAPRHGGAGLVAVFVALSVAWIMFPLLFGVDQALTVGPLATLPLTRRQLVAGLFAASLIGAPPVATLIFVAGAVPAYATGRAGTAVVALDAVLMAALAMVAGRAVSAALTTAVHSRRGRDLASVLLAVVSAASYIAWRASSALAQEVGRLRPSPLIEALTWTPPGALARSMWDAHAGHLAAATGRLGYGMAVLVLAGWAWAAALGRQLTVPAASGGSRGARPARPWRGRIEPRSPAAAVWLKDLRYTWRAPTQRAMLLTGVVTSGFVIFPLLTGAPRTSAFIPYLGVLVAFFVTAPATNAFGIEGGAFAAYILAAADARDVVRGKALAVGSIGAAVAAVAVAAGAAFSGAWAEGPPAVLASVAVAGVGAGVGVAHSVVAPFPVPAVQTGFGRPRRPRGRGSPGAGIAAIAVEIAMIGLVVGLVALARYGLGVGALPGAVAAVTVAAAFAAAAVRFAARRLQPRLPETLLALTPRG
jgi:ABC-2 type transport system permease protein